MGLITRLRLPAERVINSFLALSIVTIDYSESPNVLLITTRKDPSMLYLVTPGSDMTMGRFANSGSKVVNSLRYV